MSICKTDAPSWPHHEGGPGHTHFPGGADRPEVVRMQGNATEGLLPQGGRGEWLGLE